MGSGKTLTAVWRNTIVNEHPDTGNPVTDVHIPNWDTLLHIASCCSELIGLGYIGVDLVLELNERPGLNIQIANRAGLLPRLQLVEKHHHKLTNIEERLAFSKEHFGMST
jgi:hypothetical protein